jgi:beta-glucosidase/6-phospho-beta-glucosidase/beta-galactosidase
MDKAGTAPAAPDGPDILQTAPLRVIDPLHRAIAARAAQVPVSQMQASRLFRSTLMGGFECASQRHRPKQRLDLLASTGHARFAAQDYRALAAHGLRTVRDGLRWHLIERVPGQYDWSSFLPMLHAAHDTGTEVIWDLCHYGWPDALDIWAPDFPARFADFAGAAARVVLGVTGPGAAYVPINEISFWAWAGGSKGFINPHAKRRGSALKTVLLKAALAGIAAIRAADPQARIIVAEPAIHVIPKSARKADIRAARAYSAAQFEAVDALTGRARPELGGRPDCVDVVGLNYYIYNQWVDGGKPVALDDLRYRPLRDLLRATHARYGKPLFLSETGIEGEMRAPWLRVIATEVAAAQAAGVPVEGLCLYPVTDYPGWGDGRHCETGLLGFPDAGGARPVDAPLAQELARLVAALRP